MRNAPMFVGALSGRLEDLVVNQQGTMWLTTMSYAGEGKAPIVKTSLAAGGAWKNGSVGDQCVTSLVEAAGLGRLEVVKELLAAGTDVNTALLRDGSTALTIASTAGELRVVRELLANGADLEKGRTDNGARPLHLAVYYGHWEVVKELLANGADKNKAQLENGITPLHMAALLGHVEVVKELLVHGADGDKIVDPLLAAVRAGNAMIAQLLVEAGANIATAIRAMEAHGMDSRSIALLQHIVSCATSSSSPGTAGLAAEA